MIENDLLQIVNHIKKGDIEMAVACACGAIIKLANPQVDWSQDRPIGGDRCISCGVNWALHGVMGCCAWEPSNVKADPIDPKTLRFAFDERLKQANQLAHLGEIGRPISLLSEVLQELVKKV